MTVLVSLPNSDTFLNFFFLIFSSFSFFYISNYQICYWYSLTIFSDNKSDHYDLFSIAEYNKEKKIQNRKTHTLCIDTQIVTNDIKPQQIL